MVICIFLFLLRCYQSFFSFSFSLPVSFLPFGFSSFFGATFLVNTTSRGVGVVFPNSSKIESISANRLHFADGFNAEFEHVSKNYKPARVRPFTAEESVDLWHKTIVHIGVKQYIKEVRIMDSGEPCVVWSSGWAMACQIAIDSTFEDGSPCGVLEVVE